MMKLEVDSLPSILQGLMDNQVPVMKRDQWCQTEYVERREANSQTVIPTDEVSTQTKAVLRKTHAVQTDT